jgi:integrase
MRLTTKTIQALRPSDKRREIKDDGCRGLYLLVQPSGAKGWAVRYHLDGKVRKATLGAFSKMGLAEARAAARKIFDQLDGNIDPREAERQAAAEAKAARARTFGVIARRFLADSRHKRSVRDIERRLKPLIAAWEDRSIGTIRRRDVIELVDAVKLARGPYAGVGALAWIKRVLNYAVEKAEIESSPAIGIKPPATPRVRERVLSDEEVRRVWLACDQQPHPFGNYLKGLLLTGCRRTELAMLEWADVDLDEQVIIIPGHRYKNGKPHLIPLSRQELVLLADLSRLGDQYVFTATGRKPLNAAERMVRRPARPAD